MNPGTDQERYDRVLRWMVTNLEVSSSVYQTAEGQLRIVPGLSIGPANDPVRVLGELPADFHEWQLNSATALIACCYIDALGKVVTRNVPQGRGRHLEYFAAFIAAHMDELAQECKLSGATHSVDVLYGRYRCGFVHQFAEADAHWGRRGATTPYWFDRAGEPALNIDRFVRGVIDGIHDFRVRFPAATGNGPDPYANFFVWLLGA